MNSAMRVLNLILICAPTQLSFTCDRFSIEPKLCKGFLVYNRLNQTLQTTN